MCSKTAALLVKLVLTLFSLVCEKNTSRGCVSVVRGLLWFIPRDKGLTPDLGVVVVIFAYLGVGLVS